MATWARNVNNVAVDVTTANPASSFFAALAAQFIVVPDGTLSGATYSGGTWTNPAVVALPPVPTVYVDLTTMQFYQAFAVAERIKLKLLATTGIPANSPLLGGTNAAIPQDPVIAEFWATFQMAIQAGSMVNPNLVSVQEGLAYLVTPTAPTPAVLASSARIAQISAGITQ